MAYARGREQPCKQPGSQELKNKSTERIKQRGVREGKEFRDNGVIILDGEQNSGGGRERLRSGRSSEAIV